MPKEVKPVEVKEVKKEVKKVLLSDEHDRYFTLKDDGVALELKAGAPVEVEESLAKVLVKKYPYLTVK